ncbi:MAG: hypothetical protein AAFV53_09320 [Myxococcota bacterium]
MDQLSVWAQACVNHVQAHAQKHLMPAGVAGVGMLFGLFLVYGGVFAGIFIGEAAGLDEGLSVLLMFGFMSVATFFFVLCMSVGMFAYIRYTASLERGIAAESLLPSISDVLTLIGMNIIIVSVTLLGTALCVIPGMIAGIAMSLSFVSHAIDGGGAIQNIRRSVEIFRARPLEVGLFIFLAQTVAGAVGSLPCVGLFLILPFITICYTVGWLTITEGENPLV